MSLSLIQGYSSAEEEQDEDQPQPHNSDLEDSDDDDAAAGTITAANHPSLGDRSIFDHVPNPPSASGLPSAFDAFSEIAGPPQFLNNSVEEYKPSRDADEQQGKHANRRRRKNKKDLPTVVEAKPQLVGIHERVRSDINGSQPPTSAALGTSEGGKRVPTATNPNAEDAADLLRMCLQCGIPKTYSNARGMVCPVCGDRPPKDDTSAESKKKGSTVKDKEKSKRMKGQSSHATICTEPLPFFLLESSTSPATLPPPPTTPSRRTHHHPPTAPSVLKLYPSSFSAHSSTAPKRYRQRSL